MNCKRHVFLKLIGKIAILIFCQYSFGQTNLIDDSSWVVGSGSVSGFAQNGTSAENVRELGTDPYNGQSVIWKSVPDANNDADGGWHGDYYAIDSSKDYRFTVWIKKTNSNSGHTLFGFFSRDGANAYSTLKLDGTANWNSYFLFGDLPTLDKWYLVVGYVHKSSFTGTTSIGGVYDPITGNKVLNTKDFKFKPEATKAMLRAYLYYDTNTSDAQYFFSPTIYEVNGQEPTIQELLNSGSGTTTTGNTEYWTENGTNLYFDNGDIGIGTSTPDSKLTVKGKIHAEEVKVDLSVPAPDYVFKKDYDLKTLEEVQNYIKENGHLPNIPSAKEMETNGVELGIMNMKLLEKIEELTLYILELKKENELIKNKLKI